MVAFPQVTIVYTGLDNKQVFLSPIFLIYKKITISCRMTVMPSYHSASQLSPPFPLCFPQCSGARATMTWPPSSPVLGDELGLLHHCLAPSPQWLEGEHGRVMQGIRMRGCKVGAEGRCEEGYNFTLQKLYFTPHFFSSFSN